jgi:hypothetical protein
MQGGNSTHTNIPSITKAFLLYSLLEIRGRLKMSLLSPSPPPPPPPPPASLLITPYESGSDTVGSVSSGSYTPLIVILIIIAVLTIASLVFAQFCVRSGRFLNTISDMESFVDQECGMCVGDGTIDVLSPVKKEDDNEGAVSDELEELEAPQDEDKDEDEDEDEDSTSQEGF